MISSLLFSLDKAFKDKSENEKWMMILMIVAVIGYASYSMFLPYAEEKLKQSTKQRKTLQRSIANNKQYMASITVGGDRDFYIKKYDRDILNLEKNIIKVHEDINFISSKVQDLSQLLFNKESWSIFLNSITAQATKQGVKIEYIDNNYVDSKGNFGHILEIFIGCEGEYKNIAKFINQIEKNVLVTDVYDTNIYLDENSTTTLADIKISVWGINK